MVKKIFIILLLSILAETKEPSPLLKQNCLKCHIKQKIPSELVYRRYLMKFSTKERMKKSLLNYLKNPKKENSIMPQQFFLKFPQKEALDLNKTVLEESVEAYLDYFDVKDRLELEKQLGTTMHTKRYKKILIDRVNIKNQITKVEF